MTSDQKLQLDYEQTVAYFLHLAETRFKLLAFLPAATAAAALVSSEKIGAPWRMGVSHLGIVVTIALIIYDQRNTHIYDRLVERAKFLERHLELPSWDRSRVHGGAFNDRASRLPHRYFPIIWHDLGLALVYSASLSGWVFMLENASLASSTTDGSPELVWTLRVFAVTFTTLIGLAIRNDIANSLAQRPRKPTRPNLACSGRLTTPLMRGSVSCKETCAI